MSYQKQFNAVLQVVGMQSRGFNRVWRVLLKDVLTDKTWEMQPGDFHKLIEGAEWSGPLLVDGLWEVKYDPRIGDEGVMIKPIFNRRK